MVRPSSGEHAIVTPFAIGGIKTFSTDDHILAFATEDDVCIEAAIEIIIALIAMHFVGKVFTKEAVIPFGSNHHVGVITTMDFIVADAAIQEVWQGAAI